MARTLAERIDLSVPDPTPSQRHLMAIAGGLHQKRKIEIVKLIVPAQPSDVPGRPWGLGTSTGGSTPAIGSGPQADLMLGWIQRRWGR